MLIATIEGRSAIPVVARELKVPADSITEALDAGGVFSKNYTWLNELQTRGTALSSSVNISTYFPDEYDQAVMFKGYFAAAVLEWGLFWWAMQTPLFAIVKIHLLRA